MSTLPSPTDCLVLKISEFCINDNSVDTVLYIMYDNEQKYFIIRGKRLSEKLIFNSYSFICDYADELETFIRFLVGKDNKIFVDLLNYQELPLSSDDITFEYLENNEVIENQLVAFSHSTYKSKKVKSALRILRNIYNNYSSIFNV